MALATAIVWIAFVSSNGSIVPMPDRFATQDKCEDFAQRAMIQSKAHPTARNLLVNCYWAEVIDPGYMKK